MEKETIKWWKTMEKKQLFENNSYLIPRISTDKMKTFPSHYHEHVEVVIVMEGSVTMEVGGEKRCLGRGDGALVYPYMLHSFHVEEAESVRFIAVFNPHYYSEFESILLEGKPKTAFFTIEQLGGCLDVQKDRLIEMCQLNRSNDLVKQAKGNAQFAAMFADVLEACGAFLAYQENHLYRMAVDYCLENFESEALTAEAVAAKLSVSKATLGRLFSEKHGGVKVYINLLRMKHAAFLLRNTDLRMSEIASRSGFSEVRSFNRAFKRTYNMTPSEYRKTDESSAGKRLLGN